MPTNDERFAHLRPVARAGEFPRSPAGRTPGAPRVPDGTPAVALGGAKPLHLRTDWHAGFLKDFALTGDLLMCLRAIGCRYADFEKALARYATFKAAYEKERQLLLEQLFAKGFSLALDGNVELLKHYQKALDPRFADKRTVEHVITAKDRKAIEDQARAAGLDPDKVMGRVEELRRKTGRHNHLRAVEKAS
jgi:hypothetical protein